MRHPNFNEPIIMIWQTGKCTMLGNYQVAEAEIDINYANQNNIQIVRRSSGGGTIFTDSGTLLLTIILPCAEDEYTQQSAKEKLSELVVDTLNSIGIPAKFEGRNDVTVSGKKISGLAQFVKNNRICSHCSLLYDTDLDMLTRVLQVDEEKIQSKAIRSVRSRVTNIKEHMSEPLSTQDFLNFLKQKLHEKESMTEYSLSDNSLAEINKIYNEKYANDTWTFGSSPKFSFNSSKRFPGGKVEVYLDVINGIVSSCSIRGDFLGIVPIRELEELFEEIEFQRQVFNDALDKISVEEHLGTVTKDELLSCIFD